MCLKPNENKTRVIKRKVKSKFIDRDVGFEFTFGFKDTLDIPEYKESEGIQELSLPKNIKINE